MLLQLELWFGIIAKFCIFKSITKKTNTAIKTFLMKKLLIIIFAFSGYLSFGQCNDFQREQCELPFGWPYEFDSQSMGTGLFPGQTFRIKAVLYEGNDYYLGFCNQDGVDNIQFKVSLNNKVLDQNFATEENKNLQYFELSIQKTIIAVIEVKLNRTQNTSFDPSNLKCMGIILGNKKTNE